jgi:hypothetical protein
MSKSQLNFRNLDDYTITVTGTITPVKSTRKYDLSPLIQLLINEGFSETEANNMVKELMDEIIEELNKKEDLK